MVGAVASCEWFESASSPAMIRRQSLRPMSRRSKTGAVIGLAVAPAAHLQPYDGGAGGGHQGWFPLGPNPPNGVATVAVAEPETVAGRWCAPWWPGRRFDKLRRARLGTRMSRCHEVDAAALPTRPSKHRGDGALQPLVSIGGNQFHPAETSGGQEDQPKGAGPEKSPALLPNESARPASSRESRRRQALNLPWPTLVRGGRDGSARPGGLRFGRRGYSEHRMLLVAGLPLHCTAPRQLRC